jgi:hypothetical protein
MKTTVYLPRRHGSMLGNSQVQCTLATPPISARASTEMGSMYKTTGPLSNG